MIDFSSLSMETMLYAALAGVLWFYFAIFCVGRSRAAGVEFQEPPLLLYGGGIKALRVISLPVFLYLGLALAPKDAFTALLAARAIPLALGLGAAAVVSAGMLGLVRFYRFWRARQEGVVYEPVPAGKVAGWIALVGGIAAAVVAGPWALQNFMQVKTDDLLKDFPVGAALAFILLVAFFWVIPLRIRHQLEDADESAVWAKGTGLELFRWTWAGVTFMASAGILAPIPGLGDLMGYPLSIPMGLAIPVAGGAIFAMLWLMPMRSLAAKAAEGDFIAKEFLPQVRFSGFIGMAAYKKRAGHREGKFSADSGKQLCPTCLRPINDINSYHDFKFDACPHCGSFIPPVFTMLDYVKNQSARLMPLLEENADKSKKKRQRSDDENRLVQDLLRGLIAIAVAERGTDLHMGMEGDKFIIKCRTDGVLYPLMEFNPAMGRPLISTLKVQANLDITERRKPQDGRFRADIGNRQLDVRVNTSPVGEGELAAMRLMYRPETAGSIYQLGMSVRNVNQLAKLIQHRSGLILVTGPTGSGKSTTLYNALEAITSGERNIITLEDPIEYEVKGVTQMQINVNKGFTFATGLRTILRQDPDVIMIGEIRDTETAKMAIDAAATGHLVFSTLHATDSIGAMGRLKDLGLELQRVAAVVLVILAQRLVRVICTRCTTEVVMTRDELARQGIQGFPEERAMLKRGLGCPHCHESGYHGRQGIYEFFVPDDYLRELIAQNQTVPTIRQQARMRGMRTLLEDGLTKVLLGQTTLDEIMRVST